MADRMLGPYRLMDLLSSGTNGDVYLAWDTRLNQRVRLTRLPQLAPERDVEGGGAYGRFLNVMRRLADLRHPSIASPTDFSSPVASEAWFVTDHAEGVTLAELRKQRGRLPWRLGAMILHEVAAALAFAHGRDIAHGQLGLSNVVIEPSGRIQILGFDVVARVLLDEPGTTNIDLASVYQELAYLAPEALQRNPPTLSSDVFSLGILAYELLVGTRPFASPMEISAHAQARRSSPDPGTSVGGIPLQLRRLVQAMLAPRPENRPRTAALIRDGTAQVLRQAGIGDVRASLRSALEADAPDQAPAAAQPTRRPTEPLLKRRSSGTRPMKAVSGPARRETEPMAPAADPSRTPPPTRKGRKQTADITARPGEAVKVAAKRPTRTMKARGGRTRSTETMGSGKLFANLTGTGRGRGKPDRSSPLRTALVLMSVLVLAGGAFTWWWFSSGPTARPAGAGAAARAAAVAPAEAAARAPTRKARRAGASVPEESLARPAPLTAADEYGRKAQSLLAAGQFDAAVGAARIALTQSDVDQVAVLEVLARAQEGQGDVDAAVATWLERDDADLEGTAGHRAAGFLLARHGRCTDAIPLFQQARLRGDVSAELAKLLGNCHHVEKQWREAEAILAEATAASGEPDLDILLPLGGAREKLGDKRGAIAAYRAAIAADPDDPRATKALARLDAAAGNLDAVFARLGQDAAPGEEVDLEALELKAEAAFRAGKFGTASSYFKKLIQAAGDEANPAMLRNYALALDKGGFTGPARSAYAAAVRANDGDAELHYLYGRLLARTGRHRDAVSVLRRAARIEPGRMDVRFDLGLSLMARKDWSGAADTFDVIAKRRPGDERALQNLGAAQVEGGRYDAALRTFEKLANLRTDDPSPVLTMAALMQRMERRSDALAMLEEACRRGAQEACQ